MHEAVRARPQPSSQTRNASAFGAGVRHVGAPFAQKPGPHRLGALRDGVTASVIQGAWKPVPERKGYDSWDDTSSGMRWYQHGGATFFEVVQESAPSALRAFAGEEHAQPYEKWLELWAKHGWLSPTQVTVRKEVERVPGSEREDADEYDPDERVRLASYLDRLPLDAAMEYLATEFSASKIPEHLAELGRDAQFSIRRATARRFADERPTGMREVASEIAKISPPAKTVLFTGGSKDFGFPYIISHGAASYYLVSGEIASAEALRKTIMTYTPGVVPSILKTFSNDKMSAFQVTAGDNAFDAFSYDMSYGEFFDLQRTPQGRAAYGIPTHFDVIMDQMSWMTDAKDLESYAGTLQPGSVAVLDSKIATFLADILGLTLVFSKDTGGETLPQYEYGYRPAAVYQRRIAYSKPWNDAATAFFGATKALLKGRAVESYAKLSKDDLEREKWSVARLHDQLTTLLGVAVREGLQPFVESIQKQLAVLPKVNLEEDDDEEEVVIAEK